MSLGCPSPPSTTLSSLQQALPTTPLYEGSAAPGGTHVGWLLSPQPYALTPDQAAFLQQLGPCLYRFSRATDALYKQSLKDPELAWIKRLFQAGKPESLLTFSEMNRFKHHIPLVIRPDLLVTENGFTLCEIDAVPGGIGFTAALHQAYQALGFSLVGDTRGIPAAFLSMLLAAAPKNNLEPFIAIVVSDEAGDYRLEMQWLAQTIQAVYPHIALIHPRQISLEHNKLGFLDAENRFTPIDIVYRFFELFDLPNIPQVELIQYAVKKGLVVCTPPFKPHLEEKLTLALIHAPSLAVFWQTHLAAEDWGMLKALIPESWILDPAPVPPFARIMPELNFNGREDRDFTKLSSLTQKQRRLVIKPSGFSPQAWGSRGITVGHDVSQEAWAEALENALTQCAATPHLLQRFENARVEPYTVFEPQTGEVVEKEGRTRLCPYYFVENDTPHLAGVLATTCPKEKKVIHGMSDGVMRPVSVK